MLKEPSAEADGVGQMVSHILIDLDVPQLLAVFRIVRQDICWRHQQYELVLPIWMLALPFFL